MTQEQKNLLLKDLCGRLPYEVKIEVTYSKDSGSSLRARLCCEGINTLDTNILWLFQQSEIYIKPYLFPLESMTEEQKLELSTIKAYVSLNKNKEYLLFDWLNATHFDYRNLLEKGLANDATGKNIY